MLGAWVGFALGDAHVVADFVLGVLVGMGGITGIACTQGNLAPS